MHILREKVTNKNVKNKNNISNNDKKITKIAKVMSKKNIRSNINKKNSNKTKKKS